MPIKRITVRVSPELHEQVAQAAARDDETINRFIVEALETRVRLRGAKADRWPLRKLSELLATVAQASALTEEELLDHVQDVRRRIWQERYERVVRALEDEVP